MEAKKYLAQLADLQLEAGRSVMKAMIKAGVTKKLLVTTNKGSFLLSIVNNNAGKDLEIDDGEQKLTMYTIHVEDLLDILEFIEEKYSSSVQ